MPVVPGDELRRRVGAGTVLALDPQSLVVASPDRIDDGVVALEELGPLDIQAQLDAPEEAEAGMPPPSSRSGG